MIIKVWSLRIWRNWIFRDVRSLTYAIICLVRSMYVNILWFYALKVIFVFFKHFEILCCTRTLSRYKKDQGNQELGPRDKMKKSAKKCGVELSLWTQPCNLQKIGVKTCKKFKKKLPTKYEPIDQISIIRTALY